MDSRGSFFREVHKNTWLKRLTAEGRRVTIGPKKSDRTWVVFCVHDDTDALLEGYAEPRLAPSHNPEWTLSLQSTLHISHALVHNDKEFEFVITMDSGIVRFHAPSWEIMQEWVEVLRQKLREMKILSPKENLYTKLPEGRVPLLPTRDPTSPLPATPPVPAAIVPGIECVTTTTVTGITVAVTSVAVTGTITTTNTITDVIPSTSQQLTEISNNSITTGGASNQTITTAIVHQESPSSSSLSSGNQQRQQNKNKTAIRRNTQNLLNLSTNSFAENTPRESVIITHSGSSSNSLIPNTENSIRVDVIAPADITVTESSQLLNTVGTSATSDASSSYSGLKANPIDTNNINASTVNVSSLVTNEENCDSTNIMIIQVSNPEPEKIQQSQQNRCDIDDNTIFKFSPLENITDLDDNYKSNVHIIPSCLDSVSVNSSPIRTQSLQYSTPIKISGCNSPATVTTVKVRNNNSNENRNNSITDNINNNNTNINNNTKTSDNDEQQKKISEDIITNNQTTKPKCLEKIILSSGVTNISVGNDDNNVSPHIPVTSTTHYDKVFFATSSTPSNSITNPTPSSSSQSKLKLSLSKIKVDQNENTQKKQQQQVKLMPCKNKNISRINNSPVAGPSNVNSSTSTSNTTALNKKKQSPLLERRRARPLERIGRENFLPSPQPILPLLNCVGLLTRGATEAVITARPSRIDLIKRNQATAAANSAAISSSGNNGAVTNNLHDVPGAETTRSKSLDRRCRSSSASETERQLLHPPTTLNGNQQFQPFRLIQQDNKPGSISKKLTLREQQVMHLRREIMHPGGIRLQLRRKDCLNSIAWVDIFGTVWVAGWKQKEHPMLYNALHIGDQLISIAGNPIKTATEANKIIRNSNTLFLEILIRRVPFGRVYAIRREIEGQCLGLIRDGNTATIVDVIPNSLSARHGLPPKVKTCDGLSLTFWVLTEINGRPLNLFCKDNEVHDRLNSVGRDISILVQPLDLITKLRKQLKSIRSFKEYIIQ